MLTDLNEIKTIRKINEKEIHSKEKNSKHNTTSFETKNGKKIYCDEGIVDLIKELWENKYKTYNSCQGDKDSDPYVMVDMPKSFKRYMQLLLIIRKYWENDYIAISFNAYSFTLCFYNLRQDKNNADISWCVLDPFKNSDLKRDDYDV